MAHAQKPDLVFRRNGRVHLYLWGASVQSTTGSRGVRISGSNAEYTKFRGSAKRYERDWLPNPFASFPFTSPPCVTVCHHVSTGLYLSTEQYGFTFTNTALINAHRQENRKLHILLYFAPKLWHLPARKRKRQGEAALQWV